MNEIALKHIQKELQEKTGKLDLTGLNLTGIPKEITGMTWLKELYLPNNKISKLEGLDSLKSLSTLYLHENEIPKLEGLEGLTNLNMLSLHSNKIPKIEGLKKLRKLSMLYLYNNQISKIENLENLNSLKVLYLNSNQISKIENLESLSHLNMLNFHSNQISKIENLENLSRLSLLYLHHNPIRKIAGLEKLLVLKILSFGSDTPEISVEPALLEKIPILNLKGLAIKNLDLFSSRTRKGAQVFGDIPNINTGKSENPTDVNFLLGDGEYHCKKGIYAEGLRVLEG